MNKDIQNDVKQFLVDRGWDKLRPGDLAKSISIEAAELLEHFQWSNPDLGEVKSDEAKMIEIKKELSDVMIYALQMAALLELDATSIISAKLAKAAEKYPAELMMAREGVGPGAEDAYLKIKKEYRQQGK